VSDRPSTRWIMTRLHENQALRCPRSPATELSSRSPPSRHQTLTTLGLPRFPGKPGGPSHTLHSTVCRPSLRGSAAQAHTHVNAITPVSRPNTRQHATERSPSPVCKDSLAEVRPTIMNWISPWTTQPDALIESFESSSPLLGCARAQSCSHPWWRQLS
jgi:hypothetical protein